jgi:hypothetical protein
VGSPAAAQDGHSYTHSSSSFAWCRVGCGWSVAQYMGLFMVVAWVWRVVVQCMSSQCARHAHAGGAGPGPAAANRCTSGSGPAVRVPHPAWLCGCACTCVGCVVRTWCSMCAPRVLVRASLCITSACLHAGSARGSRRLATVLVAPAGGTRVPTLHRLLQNVHQEYAASAGQCPNMCCWLAASGHVSAMHGLRSWLRQQQPAAALCTQAPAHATPCCGANRAFCHALQSVGGCPSNPRVPSVSGWVTEPTRVYSWGGRKQSVALPLWHHGAALRWHGQPGNSSQSGPLLHGVVLLFVSVCEALCMVYMAGVQLCACVVCSQLGDWCVPQGGNAHPPPSPGRQCSCTASNG